MGEENEFHLFLLILKVCVYHIYNLHYIIHFQNICLSQHFQYSPFNFFCHLYVINVGVISLEIEKFSFTSHQPILPVSYRSFFCPKQRQTLRHL